MAQRRPGRLVECKDGKIGRTYNDLPLIAVPPPPNYVTPFWTEQTPSDIPIPPTVNKVQVFVFAESREAMHQGKTISPPEKRLCLPQDLKIIGYAD